ncbi:MAG: hypothetical protein COV55_03145 [Candidatus Komeilibacteria bacterium CG11_big_fil_rev_8_21_14_0_20_36_20]|uniref:Uncharacterized protein n=1 Tax=Candidatus Komeilibacteria bacterium CG11_big_fil_rev_8_21_14_0_20_36_20 TaxID=1974477 RepID=A0A2H0NC90_9BACT|nr:MAG: hypothetical protein COV55_03145 [Candidatus Komeilibacteria bacterium CG11_big_fil_rev_8_21_14_0_20_36_20]PIR81773.1 MAG: hypothetical protein COU21_01885 [Candidatus Komeilibacteria bacterium CG10_big_fil_rev_8_21_14_0_10_36_65]
MLKREAIAFYAMTNAILLHVGLRGLVLTIIVPVSIVIGLIKGIYKVSHLKAHWLCLGTT